MIEIPTLIKKFFEILSETDLKDVSVLIVLFGIFCWGYGETLFPNWYKKYIEIINISAVLSFCDQRQLEIPVTTIKSSTKK